MSFSFMSWRCRSGRVRSNLAAAVQEKIGGAVDPPKGAFSQAEENGELLQDQVAPLRFSADLSGRR